MITSYLIVTKFEPCDCFFQMISFCQVEKVSGISLTKFMPPSFAPKNGALWFLSHDRLKAQFCRVKLVQYSFVARVLFTLLHKFINVILKGSLFIPLVLSFDFEYLIVNPRISILV